jgi:hypothetical protein
MSRKPSGIFKTQPALLERCRILISCVPLHEVPSRLIQPDWFRQLIAHTGNEKAALQLINLPRPEDCDYPWVGLNRDASLIERQKYWDFGTQIRASFKQNFANGNFVAWGCLEDTADLTEIPRILTDEIRPYFFTDKISVRDLTYSSVLVCRAADKLNAKMVAFLEAARFAQLKNSELENSISGKQLEEEIRQRFSLSSRLAEDAMCLALGRRVGRPKGRRG